MNRFIVLTLLAATLAAPIPSLAAAELDAAAREGRALAAELVSLRPEQGTAFDGLLKVRTTEPRPPVAVRFQTVLAPSNWLSRYTAHWTNAVATNAQTLTIVHAPGQANRYLLSTNGAPPSELAGNGAMRPYAGTDFWLADLGLEFLHWPEQRLLKREMRKGRPCRVLESRNPHPAPEAYSRVVSWVDAETGGLIQAEVYGEEKRPVKEFSVGSVQKVAGRWQLKEVEIRDRRTGSRTKLEFDLTVPAAAGTRAD